MGVPSVRCKAYVYPQACFLPETNLGPLNVQIFMKIPFQSDLSGFYAIRQISSVFNISLSSPWLISSHVYYSFTLPRACGVPCETVDNDL